MMDKKKDGMRIISPTENYYQQESDRLIFIPFSSDHKELWASFFIENPTERFLGFEHSTLTNGEKAHTWIQKQIERQANNEFGQLAVIEKSTQKFIGVGGVISRFINNAFEYEITYSLLPAFWGRGFGSELAIHFKTYMFHQTTCQSVISIIHVENEASKHVARKNGMQIDREDIFLEMPVYIYRALKIPVNS